MLPLVLWSVSVDNNNSDAHTHSILIDVVLSSVASIEQTSTK